MDDQLLHERIEKYLLGEFSPAEKAQLEAEMAANPALFEQVQIQRLSLMGLQRLAGADLRKKFDRWDQELDDTPPPPPDAPPRWNVWFWSTIALLLLLATGVFWHFNQLNAVEAKQAQAQSDIARREALIQNMEADIQQKQTALNNLLSTSQPGADTAAQAEIKRLRAELDRMDQALFDQKKGGKPKVQPMAYAFPPPPAFAKRGAGNGDMIQSASEAFDNKRFAAAERLLKSIPPDDEAGQRSVTQILPYALFYNEKYGEAALAFIKLKETDRFEAKKAEWYMVLCYASEGRDAYTQKALTDILNNPQHPFYQDAQKLQGRLKKR